jgi:hypothetical protein
MLVTINYDIYLIQFVEIVVLLLSTFHLFIDSYYFYLNMPRIEETLINVSNLTLNKHLTSKLQFSPNFHQTAFPIVIIEENATLVVFDF